MNTLKQAYYPCAILCIFLAGCGDQAKNAEKTQAQQSAAAQLESVQKLVTQTTQPYHAMDNPTLLKKLTEQSEQKKEPFNSLAYRELVKRKDVSSDALVSVVKETKSADGLLPLLLLRDLDNKGYQELPVELRVDVLTDALHTSKNFNTWGLPGFYVEAASKALIECGTSAIPALKRMLSDTRPAPVFGSKMHMEYLSRKYRLCDYALFLLERIQGNEKFAQPLSVAERDVLIQEALK